MTDQPPAPAAPPPTEAPGPNKWVVAIAVMLPTFIEVMDTSVVNVSLPHIQGNLSAGLDEATWVLTSYLVANAIVIPITGWLAGLFGRQRYLIFSIVTFTLASVLCGMAPSIEILVIARIFQGLGGGGLQPLSQAILMETFPARERGMAMAVFGMGVVMAPILGPVVGGWITDTLSWRWVFYINVPAGALAVVLAYFIVRDPHYIKRAKATIDAWGLGLLAVGLGTLQIVLDKGEREDWFKSDLIVTLALISVVALIIFTFVELRREHPVVDLRVFRNRSFAAGNIIMFLGFFAVFGSIVLIPLYLQQLMGYTAFLAGLVLGPGGIASFLMMPLAGILMKKGANPRNLLAMGLATVAFSLWLMSRFTLEADFLSVSIPRVVLGVGMGLFFVPLAASTMGGIRKEKMGNASGIFNLLRNLGGSFGVAFSSTALAQQLQTHQSILVGHVTPYNPAWQIYAAQVAEYLKTRTSTFVDDTLVLATAMRELMRQASMLAFNDAFLMLALIAACLVPLCVIFKRPPEGGAPEGAVH